MKTDSTIPILFQVNVESLSISLEHYGVYASSSDDLDEQRVAYIDFHRDVVHINNPHHSGLSFIQIPDVKEILHRTRVDTVCGINHRVCCGRNRDSRSGA